MSSVLVFLLASIGSLVTASVGSPPKCQGSRSCKSDANVRTGNGGVLLQTVVDKEGVAVDDVRDFGAAQNANRKAIAAAALKGMPLKGRVTGLETAIAETKARLSALQTEVTGATDIEAGAALTMVSADEEDSLEHHHHDNRVSLVAASVSQEAQQAPAIKDRLAAIEKDVADLKSKTSTLENDVMGAAFAMKASLLEEKASGSSLKSRIVSVEDEVDSLRGRVSSLEHAVTG